MRIVKSLGVALVRMGVALIDAVEEQEPESEPEIPPAPESDIHAANWMGYTGPSVKVTSAAQEMLVVPQPRPRATKEEPQVLKGSLAAQRQGVDR